jgi:hypothetical protein
MNEYLNIWHVREPLQDLAEQLFIEYYYLTETFDRKICNRVSHRDGETAIPTSGLEYSLCGKHAGRLMATLSGIAKKKKIPNKTLQDAKFYVLKLNYDTQKKYYERYDKHYLISEDRGEEDAGTRIEGNIGVRIRPQESKEAYGTKRY